MFFAILKRSSTNPNLSSFLITEYSTRSYQRNNLYSRISPLGNPSISIAPVLDQWVEERKKVKEYEFRRLVHNLCGRRRYSHALEISEWMSTKGLCPFSTGDRAVQLDLIGRVRGLDAAETFFHKLDDEEKINKTYGALLNCYVRDGIVDKAISHLQKMEELGFASSTLNYDGLMCLYIHIGQLEKIPDVFSQMKKNGVLPSNFSYRICMNAYGNISNLNNVEILLKEMESQPHITMDWLTYSIISNVYIKSSLKEKAIIYLKKMESKIHKDALGYNHLISLYASIGNKAEMRRLWVLQKFVCKKQMNRDYITMLGCLVKLSELDEAKDLLEEWELSNNLYDFRVPNVLLIGYCKKGLIKKAEALLEGIISKGKTPSPNSWSIIASANLNEENMEKAFECMKNALTVRGQNPNWRPKPLLVSSILSWLKDRGGVEVESFISSLKKVIIFFPQITILVKHGWCLESLGNEIRFLEQ